MLRLGKGLSVMTIEGSPLICNASVMIIPTTRVVLLSRLRLEGVLSVSLVVLKVRLAARLMAGHGGGTVSGLFTVMPTGKALSAVYAPSDRDGSAIQPSSGSTSCGAPNARSRLRQAHAA